MDGRSAQQSHNYKEPEETDCEAGPESFNCCHRGFSHPQESATANSLGGRFSPTHYPKETAVQKIQVVVQKMQANHSDFEFKLSFGFECTSLAADQRAPEYSLGRASNRKEYEKVRSMPWKTGIRCPFP
jgi:hypothetical protein